MFLDLILRYNAYKRVLMPNNTEIDIVIIGAGTAGMTAYREAKKHTSSIALIEADQYGTTCARVGCMPSKLLIAAAEASHSIDKAKYFGINTQNKNINGKEVLKRVREERDRFVSFVLKDIESFDQNHLYKSRAKFIDSNTLELENGDHIYAKSIIIAVGSRASIPDEFKVVEDRLVISDDVFYWKDLPKSIAVIGAGIVGLEIGQALSRLGVQTKIFNRSSHVGGLVDPDLIELGVEIFSKELDLELNSKIEALEKKADQVKISYKNSDKKLKEANFDYVLVATGRRSNTDSLQLENTKIKLNDKGVPVCDLESCQTSEPHIFIVGDANGRVPLLHEAADEGKIAAKNAASYIKKQKIEKHKRRTPLTIIFSDPQIMKVGLSSKQLNDESIAYETGEVSFKNQGRARSFLVNQGLLKVYAEKKTGEVLGAEMLGPSAEHLAHILAWSIQSSLSVEDLLQRPFYHPTIEEGLRTALKNCFKNLKPD